MPAVNVNIGDRVIITPRVKQWREFFAFVDGWRGTVTGWNNGNAEVQCLRPDGQKTLYVPPECLTLTV